MDESTEWSVDWEVEVEITLTKTVTVGRSEVIEATTAEEAVETAREEMFIDLNDLDLSSMLEPTDFDMEDPDMTTFKVIGSVTEF